MYSPFYMLSLIGGIPFELLLLNGFEQFLSVLAVFLIYIIFFLLLRRLMLWYFKINVMIENQEYTNELLEKLIEKIDSKNPPQES